MSVKVLLHTSKANNEKVGVVTREELDKRPAPEAMGRFHRPIAYGDLVRTFDQGLADHSLEVINTQLILARAEKLLIATYELNGASKLSLPNQLESKTLLVLMASENQLTSCRARVGAHISVCDNLMISSGQVIVSHKFTTQAQILNRIYNGLVQWKQDRNRFEGRANALSTNHISDDEACHQILELSAGDIMKGTRGVVPFKYAQKAYDEYFKGDGPDTAPRTEWGLYNSWTRALREAPTQSKINASVAVSGFYRI